MVVDRFLNKSNLIILIIVWGGYCTLIFNRILKPELLQAIPQNMDYISLFAAFSAITGILYSNYKSDVRNKLNLKNSNKQLIEQMTRNKKEDAIFQLLNSILTTLNKDMKLSHIPWVATGKHFKESVEESEKENNHCYMEINLFVQNQLYYYFQELINSQTYLTICPQIFGKK